ncbi:sigma factor-like helix-turn-helix DNA-binding protein [Gimesia fumaroli]|uniref:RNA polymerase factor sigma-32 n=1 Tax=Gimesia fumaroli TaxID=2527976 RepID=A0A518I5W9_9PLAN|nr:sigma factor-like helix-turn-helix DNA-binding protein [Gimesia fumaroli]QDV48455.1 RNA polymerase factor sigma-32 [Gimesia fumaroli]
MIPKVVQPWGHSPTPLVPRAIIQKIGHLEAPHTFKNILGEQTTLSNLDNTVWDYIDSISSDCLSEIVELLKQHFNKFKYVAIYLGEPLGQPIETLPFSTRTRNAILSHPERFSAQNIRFNDILSVPSFGMRSAIEFACVIEASVANSKTIHKNSQHQSNAVISNTAFSKIESLLQIISAWAIGERKVKLLSEALPDPLLEWPEEIRTLWDDIGSIHPQDFAGDLVKKYSVPFLVSKALTLLDHRLLEIAKKRICVVSQAATLEELGEKFGISRERVRQLEKSAIAQLERFHNKEFLPVIRRAITLRKLLGNAVLADHGHVKTALYRAVEDFDDESFDKQFVKALILWLAGPYQLWHQWLLADKNIALQTTELFIENSDNRGVIPYDTASEILDGLGINQEYHKRWLEKIGSFLNVDDGYIYFQGGILDKAKILLKYYDKPMTVEEMLDSIGSDSIRSVRQRLIDDPGLWRINKQNEFVLAGTEGYFEYSGIIDEIIQEIALCGGQAKISHLVEKISRVYGVKESSILSYLNTPMFVKNESGIIRIRDSESEVKVSTDITKTAACYLTDNRTWCWRVKVDKDLLRGSGRLLPNAFAQLLGCNVGDKIEVITEFGTIALSWQLTSTTGASIGSLRQVLHHFGANLGDYLFVKATTNKVNFLHLEKMRLDSTNSNLIRLAMLLGAVDCRSEVEAISKIAIALDLRNDSKEALFLESKKVLASKGESELADLIQKPKLSIDEIIGNIGCLFK